MSLEETFKQYAVFGRPGQDSDITSKNFSKLVKEKGLMDKKLNSTEVDMIFTKAKGGAGFKVLNFEKFKQALAMMGKSKYGKESEESTGKVIAKIIGGGGPSTSGTTKATNVKSVDKMTDTSKYTGSHKERFDDSGKGKGLEGRKETKAEKGYVGAYKGDGSYDKTH